MAKEGSPKIPSAPIEKASTVRELGTANGQFVVPENFDDPLPEEILAEFEN
jgi:hypothetical protein